MTSWQTTTEPMRHQHAAVEKLRPLRVGALFQDPGTGKTRTAIELAARRLHRIHRVVWLCPVAARQTIRHEVLKHTTCTPGDVHVFDDRTRSDRLSDAFWHIVGTESLSSSDRVTLAAHALIDDRTLVVADESDMLRTPHARRTLRATMLARPAWGRLILTGTPVPEGVQNLYSQMRFLDERILGYRSWYAFAQEHIQWDEDRRGRIRQVLHGDLLASRIAPYTYQVTRGECLDLPPQAWDSWHFEPSEEQRNAYAQAKWELLDRLDDDAITRVEIYRLFLALQQIASGFWNRRDPETGEVEHLTFPHGRLDALEAAVRRIPAAEKVIVWVRSLHSLREVAARLETLGGVALHHGELGGREREAHLAAWRRPGGARFLVGTPATGGRALTLNEARYAVFYERGFSYTENYQAELRNHRIGTTGAVTYTDITGDTGIERRIADAYAAKSSLSALFRAQVDRVKDRKLIKQRVSELVA